MCLLPCLNSCLADRPCLSLSYFNSQRDVGLKLLRSRRAAAAVCQQRYQAGACVTLLPGDAAPVPPHPRAARSPCARPARCRCPRLPAATRPIPRAQVRRAGPPFRTDASPGNYLTTRFPNESQVDFLLRLCRPPSRQAAPEPQEDAAHRLWSLRSKCPRRELLSYRAAECSQSNFKSPNHYLLT